MAWCLRHEGVDQGWRHGVEKRTKRGVGQARGSVGFVKRGFILRPAFVGTKSRKTERTRSAATVLQRARFMCFVFALKRDFSAKGMNGLPSGCGVTLELGCCFFFQDKASNRVTLRCAAGSTRRGKRLGCV